MDGPSRIDTDTQEGGSMSRLVALCSTAALLVFAASASNAHAEDSGRTLAVTMTNDPVSNQIQVYDTSTKVLEKVDVLAAKLPG
jgi:hypothetical protein